MDKPHYLMPDSTQTLRDAIAELRALEAGKDAEGSLPPELQTDIEIHDVIHVLFGCSTDVKDEIIAHIWTAFGTTYPLGGMVRVNQHRDHRAVLAAIGHGSLLQVWFSQLPSILRTLFFVHRLIRPFPVEDYAQYLDQRLVDIRAEFGIRLSPASWKSDIGTGALLRSQYCR